MGKDNQRLDSWKEIADYLGREVRTAIRWENERGLPVRRVPGGMRHTVFAFTAELDAWLVSQRGGDGTGKNSPAFVEANGSGRSAATAVAEAAGTKISKSEFPIQARLPSQAPKKLPGSYRRIIGIAAVLIALTGIYLANRQTRSRPVAKEPAIAFSRTDYPASGLSQILGGDFNADGKIDLLVNSRDSNALRVMPGIGDGTFGPRIDSPSIERPEFFAVGDFNNDGKLDVVVGSQTARELFVQLGNGNGTFRSSTVLTNRGLGRAVVVGDFNNDGNLDMAAAFAEPDSVSVFLGKGDGSFVLKGDHRVTTGYLALAVADVNGDGKLDVTVTHSVDRPSSPVSVLINTGNGNFRIELMPEKSSFALRAGAGDLNGDGISDVATSNVVDSISVFLGQNSGQFTHVRDLDPEKGLGPVWIRDLDGDGRTDLLLVNCYWDRISIFLGNGDTTFKPRIDIPVGVYPAAAAIADFNGDGKMDLAIGNYGSNSISVLLNTTRRHTQ